MKEALEEMIDAKILAITDPELLNQNQKKKLLQIIRRREREGKITFLLTNEGFENFPFVKKVEISSESIIF